MPQSVLPTLLLCSGYVYISIKWGPQYMKDRPPFEIRDSDIDQTSIACFLILLNQINRSFIIIYNAFQVVLSAYLFIAVRFSYVEKVSGLTNYPIFSLHHTGLAESSIGFVNLWIIQIAMMDYM